MDYVQIWQPDTCTGSGQNRGCLVHQAGDQDISAPEVSLYPPDSDGSVTVDALNHNLALGDSGGRVMRYVTYNQALELHFQHFLSRPYSTNSGPFTSAKQKQALLHNHKLLRRVIEQVQPQPNLCGDHAHLGYTQAMYDAVSERNQRKNMACWLAWQVGNKVSNEDLVWVSLGDAKKPILVSGIPGIVQPRVSTEREERMRSLSRVFKENDVRWEIVSGNVIQLNYLRDWLKAEESEAIQVRCDREFGPGKVVVT